MTMLLCETTNNLIKKAEGINETKCCIGFDGFIDEIYRVVKIRKGLTEYYPFETIKEFSEHIREAAGKSADMEIVSQEVKFGGNAPIMANAIAMQGVMTSCIGALGFPEIHDAYKKMSSNCATVSISDPAYTHAYEFDDGKLMFGSVGSLDEVNWGNMKKRIGLAKLIKIFDESGVIGIVNWRYISKMEEILKGISEEVFPKLKTDELLQKKMFFDIADPSGRSMDELIVFLKKLREFSKYTKVILGMNDRETRIVYECLQLDDTNKEKRENGLKEMGKYIFDRLSISTLLIHTIKSAIGISDDELCEVEGFFVSKPLISTGGGDNFNAGFCVGQLLQMPLEQSLIMGNATSSFYVRNGYSPSFNELIEYLNSK